MRNEGGATVTERGADDRRAAGEREGARWPSSRGRFHGAGCGGGGAAMGPVCSGSQMEGGRSCGSHLVGRVTMARKDRGMHRSKMDKGAFVGTRNVTLHCHGQQNHTIICHIGIYQNLISITKLPMSQFLKRVIYVYAIKKVASYVYAMKKFPSTCMPCTRSSLTTYHFR
jgi:hypothetical protein